MLRTRVEATLLHSVKEKKYGDILLLFLELEQGLTGNLWIIICFAEEMSREDSIQNGLWLVFIPLIQV